MKKLALFLVLLFMNSLDAAGEGTPSGGIMGLGGQGNSSHGLDPLDAGVPTIGHVCHQHERAAERAALHIAMFGVSSKIAPTGEDRTFKSNLDRVVRLGTHRVQFNPGQTKNLFSYQRKKPKFNSP